LKFTAIDIGSNAIRILFSRVLENDDEVLFKKDAFFRVPIRLGEDVFGSGIISDAKASSLVHTMIAFQHLMEAYRPVDSMACATSAMREATNGPAIVKRIKAETGIAIEIIDGNQEASIIYSNRIVDSLDKSKTYLYIDVGGGSTELTLISGGEITKSRSFKLGTVRILKERDTKSEWANLKTWLKENSREYPSIAGIGSGGNINKIFRLSRKKAGKPLSYNRLRRILEHINSYSFEDRVKVLWLKPDRADVIVPAGRIFKSVMKWARIQRIYVPQIGLSDGIIHVLYDKHKNETVHS